MNSTEKDLSTYTPDAIAIETFKRLLQRSASVSRKDYTSDDVICNPITIDIVKCDLVLLIIMDMPGISEDDIDIDITEKYLIVKGKKKKPYSKGDVIYPSRSYGQYMQTTPLPANLDIDSAGAILECGVMHITIPYKTGTTA